MRTALALAVILASTAAAHEVRFTNMTGTTIRSLYVSPAGANDWGSDQLDKQMIDAGETFTLDLGPQETVCPFDVKAVFVDDDTAMRFAIDLCAIDDFYFRPE
jgi:hypothetical protein